MTEEDLQTLKELNARIEALHESAIKMQTIVAEAIRRMKARK